MTRKNRKGVVGKKNPTLDNREPVGVGLSFTDEHVSLSKDIERKIKEKTTKKQHLTVQSLQYFKERLVTFSII